MLIVEGPDGSGKSALVERLRSALRLPVASKVVSSDTQPMMDLATWTEANVDRGFQNTIFDRHRLISEPIYGPILRSRQDSRFLDLGWVSEMNYRFYKANPTIIYCLPPFDTVQQNVWRAETDNGVVRHSIEGIYAAYVSRASLDFNQGVARLHNYEVTRFEDTLKWAMFRLEVENERRAARLSSLG